MGRGAQLSTLFVLVFLAAIAGVFKPYINGIERKHFGIAAAVAFGLIAITAPKPDNVATASDPSNKASAPKAQIASADSAPPAPSSTSTSHWEYSESRDEMRNAETKNASVRSENTVKFDFPYGETGATLWVRKDPKFGLDVAFQVDSGQVLCHSFGDSKVWVKFDDKPIQTFTCTGTSDGSSETAFFTNGSRALAELRKAKRTIVEAEFYQEGRQQFIFDTQGLIWNQ